MLNIIIGHRGTGKSHWLNKLREFHRENKIPAEFYDLDEEIEKAEGKSLSELFQSGERLFRKKERQVFQKLIRSISKNKLCFLSVGAGLKFKKDSSWNVIYLSRHSDKMGRVFLNRPRLKKYKSPFKEYQSLYSKRHAYYLKQADEQFFRREYFKNLEESDLLFLGLKKLSGPCFTLRLNPKEIPKAENRLKPFLQKRLHWGLRFFELNDETATKSFVQKIRDHVPEDNILFSSQTSKRFLSIKDKKNWSWDLSLGPPPEAVSILALHHRGKKDLKQVLREFSAYKNYHLKLAVEIFNLRELMMGYEWQSEDPKNRSFLPRSSDGSWLWFRQAFGPRMFLHFIKEFSSKKEILDQPFLSLALPFINKPKTLAGVLGHPVLFSATPAEHDDFLRVQHSIPLLPVPLKEVTKESLKILSELGFVFFAVTSPLKEPAFLSADICHEHSQAFQTANLLIFHKKVWQAFNTDEEGARRLKKYSSENTVVWGGGGLRPVLQKHLPLARFYSARTAKPQTEGKEAKVETVIWAVGRGRMNQGCLFPPKHFQPSKVLDINYSEDSPGLEYALQTGAEYQKGWSFFKAQAERQREIFSELKSGLLSAEKSETI